MNHTPGPWRIAHANGGQIAADDPNRPGKRFLVCEIGPEHRSLADAQAARANARLIAAAPEMLKALQDLTEFIGALHGDDATIAAYEEGRAAITKATQTPETERG